MSSIEKRQQIVQYDYHEQEIDLLDIVRYIKQHFRSLFIGFIVCFLPFVFYAFTANKVFRAEAFISPPKLQDYSELNVYALSGYTPKFHTHTAESVFGKFVSNLRSREVQWDFFLSSNVYRHYQNLGDWQSARQAYLNGFRRGIKVASLDGDVNDSAAMKVSFDVSRSALAETLLNDFILYVKNRTINELLSDIDIELKYRTKGLRNDIAGKKKTSERRRTDLLIVLQEALEIATRLGVETSVPTQLSSSGEGGGISVNTTQVPLYMRGTLALEAEINALRERKSDEPYAGELRQLQEVLLNLESISIDRASISPVSIVGPPEVFGRVKPKLASILTIGVIVSLLLTIVYRCFNHVLEKLREEG